MRTESRTQSGRRKSKSRAGSDAVAMLKADHKKVLDMFQKFEKMEEDGAQKAELVKQICDELVVHTTLEEEIFYPAVRAAIDDHDLMDEAEVEHESAKSLIDQLNGMQPGDERFQATVTVLGEYIKHHVKEEHKEMFPKAKKAKVDLAALGEEMTARKMELMRQMQMEGAEDG
jgi:hemerythrin-like domain-containing protein